MSSPSFPILAAAADGDCGLRENPRGREYVHTWLVSCLSRFDSYKATDLRFVFSQQGGQDLLPSLCAPALGLGPTFGLPGSGWVWASLLLVRR